MTVLSQFGIIRDSTEVADCSIMLQLAKRLLYPVIKCSMSCFCVSVTA